MESTAEAYHRLTKYSPETLGGPGLDFSKQPDQFKDIVSSRRVSLRHYLPAQNDAPNPANGGDIARIGRLLFYSNGVTGVIRFQNGRNQYLRASPSAGALYPTEIYVALRDMDGVPAGLYNYQARNHELVCLWDGDQMQAIQDACGGHPCFESAQACLLLTGIHWRSAWRYKERGYRRVLLDTGHVVANTVAYAPHEGCTANPIQGFCDGALNGLFFFDDAKEAALMAVPILDQETGTTTPPLWASPTTDGSATQAANLECEEDLAHSATVTLHRASGCGAPVPVERDRRTFAIPRGAIPLAPAGNLDAKIPDAIVKRRSARAFTGEAVSLADLGRTLSFAFQPRYATRDAGVLDAYVVAHEVAGLDRGLYHVCGDGEALLCIDRGDLRERFREIGLQQEIARRCGAIVVVTASATESVELWGDRAYRHLHLDAGMLGERFQLAATALGLGACGIGGFFDDAAAQAVGVAPEDFVLYLVTVGHI